MKIVLSIQKELSSILDTIKTSDANVKKLLTSLQIILLWSENGTPVEIKIDQIILSSFFIHISRH